MKGYISVIVVLVACLTIADHVVGQNNNRNFRQVNRNGQLIHVVNQNRGNSNGNNRANTNRNNRANANQNRIILGNPNTGRQGNTPRRSNIVAIIIRHPDISKTVANLAASIMSKLRRIDRMFFLAGVDTKDTRSTRAMKTMFTVTKAKSLAMGEEERAKTAMVKEVADQMNILPIEAANSLDSLMDSMGVQVQGLTTRDDNCDQFVSHQCDSSSKYRTADGSCNNLRKPLWGRAFIPMRRFLQPEYDDQVSSPRTRAVSGNQLPSAREVSLTVHEADNPVRLLGITTHMLMQWGQFLDHDLTSTPIASGSEGSQVGCCSDDVSAQSMNNIDMDPEDRDICFPIRINRNDPQFGHRSCMSFVRSIQVSNANCQTAPAEQLNQITAYIDASMVYGSSDEETRNLRAFTGGLLKSSPNSLLPPDNQPSCLLTKRTDFCFKAGDDRVNEQMALTTLHTLWMREHNRMARELADLNPRWNDETIFQEARKIVGAKIQHITYNEFLTVVLNGNHRNQYNLKPRTQSHAPDTYDTTVDASIRNSFATAAYRFGHSLVRTMFSELDRGYQKMGELMLVSSFGNVSHLLEDNGEGIERYIRGLVTDQAGRTDRFMTPQITQRLFEDGAGHSLDLAALNIQRGRDHGLPGYNAWRKWCNLPVAKTFNDLVDHTQDAIRQLRKVYEHPDDIDLFAGGLSEQSEKGAVIGKTFACIIGHQFKALKDGDRFYYERKDDVTGFTRTQLRAIKQTTLSKVICDNTDIEDMQPQAFQIVRNRNQRVSCSELRQEPLTPWAETPVTPRNLGSAEWGPWSKFGTCRNGKKWRRRRCVTSGNARPTCIGPSSESEVCIDCSKSIYNVFSRFMCP